MRQLKRFFYFGVWAAVSISPLIQANDSSAEPSAQVYCKGIVPQRRTPITVRADYWLISTPSPSRFPIIETTQAYGYLNLTYQASSGKLVTQKTYQGYLLLGRSRSSAKGTWDIVSDVFSANKLAIAPMDFLPSQKSLGELIAPAGLFEAGSLPVTIPLTSCTIQRNY